MINDNENNDHNLNGNENYPDNGGDNKTILIIVMIRALLFLSMKN